MQQFINFLGKMTFCAPNQTDECQHNEYRNQSKPKWLLQHSFRQWFVRDSHHSSFASWPLPPSMTTTVKFAVFLKALATTLARIVGTRLLFLIAYSTDVALQAMALQNREREREKPAFRFKIKILNSWN